MTKGIPDLCSTRATIQAYLPGTARTVIKKAVTQAGGACIALHMTLNAFTGPNRFRWGTPFLIRARWKHRAPFSIFIILPVGSLLFIRVPAFESGPTPVHGPGRRLCTAVFEIPASDRCHIICVVLTIRRLSVAREGKLQMLCF